MIYTTEAARTAVNKMLAKRRAGLGIRIGVKTTGCSGLAYVLEYLDGVFESDVQFVQDGFIIVTDQKHLPYIDEMTIDYVKRGLNEGFEFQNPKERDRCGCGESFRV